MIDDIVIRYRIILTESPTVDDMRSHQELGIPLRCDDPETRRLARGISLFDSLEQPRRHAQWKPWLGNAFIVEVVTPHDRFQIGKIVSRGLSSLWGNPRAILPYVRRAERA